MKTEKEFLSTYDIQRYDRPSVATDVVVFCMNTTEKENFRKDPSNKLCILLIRRGEHPFLGSWALPGGFVKMDETVEQGAIREVTEETNIHPVSLTYTGVFSDVNRDPRGRIISNAFTCIFNDKPSIAAGSDAADAKWFDISFEKTSNNNYKLVLQSDNDIIENELIKETSDFSISRFVNISGDKLAFDHAHIIAQALENLRSKAAKFELIFDFLPEKFTLTSLQKVQEIITNVPSVPANFRRKVNDYVQETGEYTQGAGHRPAMLYKKKV